MMRARLSGEIMRAFSFRNDARFQIQRRTKNLHSSIVFFLNYDGVSILAELNPT
jgi:hypothetical protein